MATRSAKTKPSNNTIILYKTAIDAMQELKGVDIVLLDLREIHEASADFFIICHGTSTTHVSGIADRVLKNIWEQLGERPVHIEGRQGRQWLLLDFFSVVVHIFEREKRQFYDIESLWSDAKVTRFKND